MRRYRREHPERTKGANKRWQRRNPEAVRAHDAVYVALQVGTVCKPSRCENCGRRVWSRNLHAHHEDYSKPLEVEWLCASCHKDRHVVTPGMAT
jgi:hypothetical protein